MQPMRGASTRFDTGCQCIISLLLYTFRRAGRDRRKRTPAARPGKFLSAMVGAGLLNQDRVNAGQCGQRMCRYEKNKR